MPYPKWRRRHSSRAHVILRPVARMSRTIAALYRFLYAVFLSRLPEPAAVALGQSFLRLLPLDRLGSFRLDDPRLAIILGGVRLPNPVILAAMYYDPTILGARWGWASARSPPSRSRSRLGRAIPSPTWSGRAPTPGRGS